MLRILTLLCSVCTASVAGATELGDDPFENGAVETRAWFETEFPELFEGEDGCVRSDFESSAEALVIPLSSEQRLTLFLCQPGAYNLYYTPLLVERAGGSWDWRVVALSVCGAPSTRIVNPVWEQPTQALTFFEKGIGAGGCGVEGAVEWDGGQLSGGWCRGWHDCDAPTEERWPLTFGEEPEFLPGEFSADELAAGIANGEHYVFQVDRPQWSTQTHMAFTSPTEQSVVVVSWEVVDEIATDPVSATVLWEELATHSVYRRDRATRTETTCETALGDLLGANYRVEQDDGAIVNACFASEYPGPPVRYTMEVDGISMFGMVLVAHEISPPAP